MTKHLEFDEADLRARLSSIPAKSAAIFAYLCAARLVRTTEELANTPYLVKNIIAEANIALRRALVEGGRLPDSLEERLLDSSPTEEEDPSFEGAALEDAAAALVYTARSIVSSAAENAAFAARRAYETADRYASRSINEGEYSDLAESVILSNPVVQRELERQQRDYQFVSDGMQEVEVAKLVESEKIFPLL